MKRPLHYTAIGLVVVSVGWQDHAGPTALPPVPTKAPPRAEAAARGLPDDAVIQTAQVGADAEAPSDRPLDQLAWLVGHWVDEDENVTIETAVDWTKNGAYLRRMFHVIPEEGEPHAGMQLIGWDPAEKTIRSWTFDEDGGFGEERWRRTGDRWTIRTRYTLPQGGLATSISVLRKLDDNHFTWKSVSRMIAGALQPDIDEVTVVRKAEPGEAGTGPATGADGAQSPRPAPAVEPTTPSTPEPEPQP